jgi:hypothetical protein
MKKKLYLVQATCGEYSDRCEWPVAVYADEAAAQTHVQLATEFGKVLWANWGEDRYTNEAAAAFKLNPFDPQFRGDYTGPAEYSVTEVPLLKTPPKPGPLA